MKTELKHYTAGTFLEGLSTHELDRSDRDFATGSPSVRGA